jgi:hypothetical protein
MQYSALQGIEDGDWKKITRILVMLRDNQADVANVLNLLASRGYNTDVEEHSQGQDGVLYSVIAH